jgi:hypothetical protein
MTDQAPHLYTTANELRVHLILCAPAYVCWPALWELCWEYTYQKVRGVWGCVLLRGLVFEYGRLFGAMRDRDRVRERQHVRTARQR